MSTKSQYVEMAKEQAGVSVLEASAVGPFMIYKRRWYGVLVLSLLNICVSWAWLSFSSIPANVMELFNQSTVTPTNWLSNVILFTYVAVSPVCWWVLAKKGVRWGALTCAVLLVLGNWIRYAGVKSKLFGVLMLGQIMIGLGQPFALSAATRYCDLWFTSSSRVSANALISLSNPLGAAVGQLVGPAIVTSTDKLPLFVMLTAIVSTVCSLAAIGMPDKPKLPPCPSSTIPKVGICESFRAMFTSWSFILLFVSFSTFVAIFNSYTTFLGQIMQPYGYTPTQSGLAGALLILVGLVFSGILLPIMDRLHFYLILMKTELIITVACFVAVIFMCTKPNQIVGPYLVSSIMGATSFSSTPVILEYTQEILPQCNPAVPSTVMWTGGQLYGGIVIIIMNALEYPLNEGSPPGNMRRGLIFQAVLAFIGGICMLALPKKSATRVQLDTVAAVKEPANDDNVIHRT